ncbi:MAG: helix-turn-helix domain-containing protein [Eubacterium sp.]|nr:helix-turn-helix domain-containing protein [Eubacterium sp.]
METNKNNLMDSYEAADFLHISYWHLMDLVRRGKIPHIRFSRKVLFRETTLRKFILDLEAQSTL